MITFDVANNIGTGYPNTTTTIPHEISAGSDPVLIVTITHTGDLTSVEFDGVAMTLHTTVNRSSTLRNSVYYLFSPTQGTEADIVITPVGTQNLSVTSMSYLGVGSITAGTHTKTGGTKNFVTGKTATANGAWIALAVSAGFGTDTLDGSSVRRKTDPNLWNHSFFDSDGGLNDGESHTFSIAQDSAGGAGYAAILLELIPATPAAVSLATLTEAATSLGSVFATGNGDMTSKGGKDVTRRGFVYGTTTQSDPGDTAPESSAYDTYIAEGSVYAPVRSQRGEAVLSGGSVTITLDKPVPVGKSFPIVSVRSIHTYPAYAMAQATLQNEVDGHYTQLLIQCTYNTANPTYAWQVLWSDDFTVQTGEVNMASLTQSDVTISAVDQSKAFAVITSRNNSTGATNTYIRASFTSDTNLQLNITSSATTQMVRWYVVEWEGATVQSGNSVFDSVATVDTTITEVDLTKSFVLFTYAMEAFSTNSGVVATQVSLLNSTTLRCTKNIYWSGGIHGRVDWFVISHPSLSVQSGLPSTTGTSIAQSITAVNEFRSFAPVPLVGNAQLNHNVNGTLDGHYNSHHLTDEDTLTIARGTAFSTLSPYWQVAEDTILTFGTGAFNLTLAGLTAETTYYYRSFVYANGVYSYGDEETFTTTEEVIGGGSSAVSLLANM